MNKNYARAALVHLHALALRAGPSVAQRRPALAEQAGVAVSLSRVSGVTSRRLDLCATARPRLTPGACDVMDEGGIALLCFLLTSGLACGAYLSLCSFYLFSLL